MDWLTYHQVLDFFRGNGTLDGLRSGRFGLLLNEVCNHRLHVIVAVSRRCSLVVRGILLDVLLSTGGWLVSTVTVREERHYLAARDLARTGLASRQRFTQDRLDIRQYGTRFQ
jgi:hypothetical protein